MGMRVQPKGRIGHVQHHHILRGQRLGKPRQRRRHVPLRAGRPGDPDKPPPSFGLAGWQACSKGPRDMAAVLGFPGLGRPSPGIGPTAIVTIGMAWHPDGSDIRQHRRREPHDEFARTGPHDNARRRHVMPASQIRAQRRIGRIRIGIGHQLLQPVQHSRTRAGCVGIGGEIMQRHAVCVRSPVVVCAANLHGKRLCPE